MARGRPKKNIEEKTVIEENLTAEKVDCPGNGQREITVDDMILGIDGNIDGIDTKNADSFIRECLNRGVKVSIKKRFGKWK